MLENLYYFKIILKRVEFCSKLIVYFLIIVCIYNCGEVVISVVDIAFVFGIF